MITLVALALCSLFISNAYDVPIHVVTQTPPSPDADNDRQYKQDEFLQSIAASQSNCSNPNIILLELFGEDPAEIHHFVGNALQTALAAKRRLHIMHKAGACNDESLISSWKCIYAPLTECAVPADVNTTFAFPKHPEFSFYRYYLNSAEAVTFWNAVVWHEILSRQSKAEWFTGVFASRWFGRFGNVFVRASVQSFVWNSLNAQHRARMQVHATNLRAQNAGRG